MSHKHTSQPAGVNLSTLATRISFAVSATLDHGRRVLRRSLLRSSRVAAVGCALAGLVSSGCSVLTRPASSERAHGLSVEAKSSKCVQINVAQFQMNHGQLELAGSISKSPSGNTTAFSHLEILFYDGAGAVLQTKSIAFAPRMVGDSRFSSKFGYFTMPVEPLPAGTVQIVVRAKDQAMASTVSATTEAK